MKPNQKAYILTNIQYKSLYDVICIDSSNPGLSEVILTAVEYSVARQYAEDFNKGVTCNHCNHCN